ncbi:hypothetical protein tloyanaT_23310 [Thalassotalea loyana]|uniref:TnsE C-terminal domain-containing protein n=1 Tax=Thalassotalea loyana TaxID=280483 RepID=A0ABQ6HDA9_9GAMM|nr:Tn7-like element transposition protein TnsE [Thalassotalea loyana]GLX86078.1 hypothetical protein tloyanaT_23310 [Thalassotalea loyana]
MIRGAIYKHIEDDSKITGIDSLFRGIDRKLWSINLYLSGKQANSLNFSAVPILARRRILNPTQQHNNSGKVFKFTISDAQNWQVAKLNDCLAFKKAPKGQDGNQYCFVSEESKQKIYIPQLEMARVLFYHDPYMARLSLQHNALAEDFYVELKTRNPTIYVRDGTEYPLHYFNRDDNRRFLSWVLMDKHARQSFESISINLLTQHYRRGNYDFWNFQFSPPPLNVVELEVTGWQDFESKSFLVWEIRSVSGLASSVTGEVDIVHPKYERSVGGKSIKGDVGRGQAPDEYELDDDELSDTDKATVNLLSDRVAIKFKDPFITNRVNQKTKPVKNITGEGEKEILDKELSANEKEVTGNLAGGVWNNLDDQTDDAHLYLSKFQSFLNMVEVLQSAHGFSIRNKTTVKLPKLGDGKKHWLADSQNPRCLAIVELIYSGQQITLLEVDTSDGAAKLSTMMLKTAKEGWAMDNIENIKLGVMKKSLGWPTALFEQWLTKSGFSGIPHPKSKHSGLLPPEEIAPWAQRFVNWIKC